MLLNLIESEFGKLGYIAKIELPHVEMYFIQSIEDAVKWIKDKKR